MFNYGLVYFILIFVFFLIGIKIKENYINIYLILFNFIISAMSFFIQPASFYYSDMERFNLLLSSSRSINNLSGIFSGLNWLLNSSEYVGQPLVCFYIWILSFFNYNNWFFAITTFIFIGCFFAVMRLMQKELHFSNTRLIMAITLFFLYFNLFFEIEGIRNFLAFIIIVLAFYYDLYGKKTVTPLILYIIAVLMHPSSIIVIAIIFGLKIINYIKKISNVSLVKLFAIILLFSNYIILFVSKILPQGQSGFFQVIQGKSDGYVSGNSSFQAYASASEIIVTSILFVFLIISILYAYILFKKNKLLNENNSTYFNLLFLLISFNIGSFQSTQIYLRIIMLILFFTLPLISYILSVVKDKFIFFFYLVSMILTAALTAYYWYLISYSHLFINFSNFIQ